MRLYFWSLTYYNRGGKQKRYNIMIKLKRRILKAAFKRGNKLTQTELTRFITRVSLEEKQKAIKELEREGYIEIVVTKQLKTTGLNPTCYYLTAIGVAVAC